ncbi:hypothetical protein BsWGS_10010 [Bradybaena similaris]
MSRKLAKVFAILFSIVTLSCGLPGTQKSLRFQGQQRYRPVTSQNVGADLCPLCIQFTDEALNILLNIILNTGIVGSCEVLCSALEQKTGSKVIGAVCNILCDIEGIKEFVKLIEQADLDPIYFCELLKVCPVFDAGDATITRIIVSPQAGPQGERAITFVYVSKNGTGTGEIVIAVRTVDGIPIESAFLQEPRNPGTYNQTVKLDAEPDPDCDPTQGPCEQWLPGSYTLIIELCNGECGSKHPHSKVYDRKETNFTITG